MHNDSTRENNMEITKLNFEGTFNTRDLGGFPTKDGRKIKNSLLIRSDNLGKITQNDKYRLENDYKVTKVIDFRTDTEVGEQPDVMLDTAEYIRLKPLSEAAMGVTHEKKTTLEMFTMGIDGKTDPDTYMTNMYEKFIFSEDGRREFAKFFHVLDEADGCVLWHCTAGKDRAGTASALIEYALGVDEELIFDDYYMTNIFSKENVDALLKVYLAIPGAMQIKDFVIALVTVRREYMIHIFDKMKKEYGSVSGYISNGLGIGSDLIERLKNKYLTEA